MARIVTEKQKAERRKRSELKKKFLSKSPEWRIEAVIHDGSWYDITKWAKIACVDRNFLESWIMKNEKISRLIKSKPFGDKGCSYRVGYNEIINWYNRQEDIDIKDNIVPNNYPPRLWNGQTEVEGFLSVPRRATSTLTFYPRDSELLKKCINALSGVGRVRYDKNDKYRASGLSDTYMQQVLRQNLTDEEFKSLNIKKRKGMLHRELTDFPEEFAIEAIQFYIPYSRNALKRRMSTITIYLKDEAEIEAQIIAWIVAAMRKFDETKPVPFSGYLTKVLNFWPYDLPDEFLGKELSKFQRERQKAIDSLTTKKNKTNDHSNEEIAIEMGIKQDTYVRLDSQHKAWLAELNATDINWEDSANEKQGELLGDNTSVKHDEVLAHGISIAAINASLKTSNFEAGSVIIESLDNLLTENALSVLSNLDDEFKKEFAYELSKNTGSDFQ